VSALAIIAAGMVGVLAGWVACALFTAQGRDDSPPDEDDALDRELEALDPRQPWRDGP
jgi:hypothetical protein